MPAVGADGKNIMKLIPVQMINGEFVQGQSSNSQSHSTPQKTVNMNLGSSSVKMVKKTALNSAAGQISGQQDSLLNVLPNYMGLDPRNLLKSPLHSQTIPPVATISTISEKLISVSRHLPVMVKSPVLPRGHYLQIPPNAQIRTVPASELPPAIKKQIFTSASFAPGSGVPSVVYVSPVSTINQCAVLPSNSALHSLKLLSKTSNTGSREPPSKGFKRRLKLIPKVSQRPNSPIKWMIEEEDTSTSTTLNPLTSSEILLTMAQSKNAINSCDVMTEPASQVFPTANGQGEENALVMCNGKVFFVAKRSKRYSLPNRMQKRDSLASSHGEFKKSTVVSSQQSLQSVTPEIRQDISILIPDESDEVIDLCDDDDDLSQKAAPVTMPTVTHSDEDNVIFVSYIPPKSKCTSEQDLTVKTQLSFMKRTDHIETCSLDSVTEQKRLDKSPGGGDNSPLRGTEADQSVSVSTVNNIPDVCGSIVMKMHDNSQPCTSIQQLKTIQSPSDTSTSDSSAGASNSKESSLNHTTVLKPSPAPRSNQMADHMLRQMFSITADVKILLQRIDEASAVESLQRQSIMLAETLLKKTSWLRNKDCLLQNFNSPQEMHKDSSLIHFKPVESVAEQNLLADPPSPNQNVHTAPLKCSHFKKNTDSLSKSSLTETSYDVMNSALCYVEPIDEDFLSTDENDIPNSQNTDARQLIPTCVDLIANTRMGRTRKRTICPCCKSGSQGPAVKSNTKTEQPMKWTWMTAKMSKKSGRTKTLTKIVKASGRITCLTAKNEQISSYEGSDSNIISASSMGNDDELKRHEKLKDLLIEKESSLELMRHGMN
ncbi:ligand-dependent nuclear receptor-interacting factor 1 isoform X2 [Antennarius striatus]